MADQPQPGGSSLRGTLLLQFLPLLVYAVVDGFVDDPRLSIGVAMVFAVLQLAVTWLTARRLDWFLVLDAALIAVMGGVSIALADDFFFKLKPAIVEGLTVVVVLGMVMAPAKVLIGYFGRFLPGTQLTPESLGPVKRLLVLACVLISVHAGLVVVAAQAWSKETWAAVSGPGFYVLFVPLFGVAWLQRRKDAAKRP